MQFSTVAIFAATAAAVSATTLTETEVSSTLVTITSCDSTVTDCPAKHTSASNYTVPVNVTTASENGAAKGQFAAAGVAALAAGALLAL
ncbi:hypothetical protein CAAN1_12S04720 [[Candida] anglica]|uniref:Uncharacterized protein n=1 Tax=[Candida] anglica TaxID=148631 RepID=A0ABP0EA38_9ASCO